MFHRLLTVAPPPLILTLPMLSFSIVASSSPSFSASATSSTTIKYDEWEKQKQSCPLCVAYIESPCRQEFKDMLMCSDRAHAENEDVDICTEKLLPLLACEKKNLSYFQSHKSLKSESE